MNANMDKKETIEVLYFASLSERVACERESMTLDNAATVADVIDRLKKRGGDWRAAFQRDELGPGHPGRLLCAVNQQIAKPDTAIKGGDELAFFPPVTGG